VSAVTLTRIHHRDLTGAQAGGPSHRMMQESDESGDHRSGAPQRVLLDAVKPRWSLAHGGDDHIADFLTPPHARVAHGGIGGQS